MPGSYPRDADVIGLGYKLGIVSFQRSLGDLNMQPQLRITRKIPSPLENHCAVNHINRWILLRHGRSNWTNWTFAIYLFHKAPQKLKTLSTKTFCLLCLTAMVSTMILIFFSTAGVFFAQSFNGISCFSTATAIFMVNPKHNVLNQFNTQTTLYRHYRDGIWSSIKMIHNLFWSYVSNNSSNHLYYRIWNRS